MTVAAGETAIEKAGAFAQASIKEVHSTDNLSEITEVLRRIADAVEYLAAEHKKAEEIRKSKMEKRKEKAARDLWLIEHGYKTGLLTIVEDDE